MFVHRSRHMTKGALATVALLGLGSLTACDDPVAQTDLRSEGEPEVLSVLVMNDPSDFIFEGATFCKPDDTKRPGLVAVGETFVPVQVCDTELANGAGARAVDNAAMCASDADCVALEVVGMQVDGLCEREKVCSFFVPATVTDAVPTAWYARIMFDELLDPDVEELLPIDGDPSTPEIEDTGKFSGSLLNTQPVTLECGGNPVAYDGYYSPSGNAFTWPLGPSLVIAPTDYDTVATSSTCTVTIRDTVVDKQGLTVPQAQRGGTLYTWDVAPLAQLGISPEPADPGDEESIAVDAPVAIQFNANIDTATITTGVGGEIEIREGAAADLDCASVTATGVQKAAAAIAVAPAGGESIEITVTGGWTATRMYAVTFSDTNAITDLAGGPGAIDPGTVCFIAE